MVQINAVSFYTKENGYADLDREAAAALRTPLLMQLLAAPDEERYGWLQSLIAGLSEGLACGGVERDANAHAIGQRMALLLAEEGHA